MINWKVAWAASRIFQIIIMGRLVENGIANDISSINIEAWQESPRLISI